MRHLYLLRHAKSDPAELGQSDHSRALNLRGKQAAERMGRYLQGRGILPHAVLVSSSRRTRQTLDGLCFQQAPALVSLEDELYLADPERILELLRRAGDEIGSVMVIGHNPGMHELVAYLAQAGVADDGAMAARLNQGFPTTALAEFEILGSWRELAPGQAKLLRLTIAADLPQ